MPASRTVTKTDDRTIPLTFEESRLVTQLHSKDITYVLGNREKEDSLTDAERAQLNSLSSRPSYVPPAQTEDTILYHEYFGSESRNRRY